MRLILVTLAVIGLLVIGLGVSVATGVLRLPQLELPAGAGAGSRPTTGPAAAEEASGASRTAAGPSTPADALDPPDPVLPDPPTVDRTIVLAAADAKLSGPRVRLYAAERDSRRDHDKGMGRQRVRIRRLRERGEEDPPPPVIEAWSGPQDVAEWSFAVPQAGRYAVTFVYTGGDDGPFELAVGEEKVTGEVESTGRGYRMIEVGRVNLTEGGNTLRLRPVEKLDEPLMTLRSIKLYPLP